MDFAFNMATSRRHNKLLRFFSGEVLPFEKKKLLEAFQEECSLVYSGKRWSLDSKLINLKKIENHNDFRINTIQHLSYLQPDFMLFHKNKFLISEDELRVAGYPDLIIEVWSPGNLPDEREFKRHLYSTSDITEQWYLTTDSNKIEVFTGVKKMDELSLTDVLKTQSGLTFDLRHLAL